MRTAITLLSALCGAASFAPAAALAQDPGSDPVQGSPSGSVYEIPLERGRHDAAPRPAASTRGSAGAGSAPSAGSGAAGGVSPIHTENGFGSSSTVPGAPASASAGGGKAGSRAGGTSSTQRGAKGGKAAPGVSEQSIRQGEAQLATAAGSPSSTRAMLLLALALVVAAVLGLAVRGPLRRK